MKRTPIVSMVALALLSVVLVSCGMQHAIADEGFEEDRMTNRPYYYNSPWAGPNTIVVERDPFTGRYYQVAPGGFYSPWGYDPWLYAPRTVIPRGGGWYNGPRLQRGSTQTPQHRAEGQRQNNAARDQILGPRKQN